MGKAQQSRSKRRPPNNMNAGDTALQTIFGLVRRVRDLEHQAAPQYQPVVDDILLTRSKDVRHIEHTLDRLLDFCGSEPVLAMYKQLCRHYWDIDPEAAVYYVNSYREYWDSDEPGSPS